MFISTGQLVIPTLIPTNEANADEDTWRLKIELLKIESASFEHNLNTYMCSYTFHSLNHYVLFYLKDNYLFHQFFLI